MGILRLIAVTGLLFFSAISPAMAIFVQTVPSVPQATVPEPGSLALLAIGVAGARLLKRRKN